jgi:PAS domain S-box-containing protein
MDSIHKSNNNNWEYYLLQRERLRLLIEGATAHSIIMLDPDGVIISWNEGAKRMKGYDETEIVGTHFSRLYLPEEREAGKPQQALQAAREQGIFEATGWRVRKDGSRFWAHVTLTPLHNEGGLLQGFAKITMDFTDKKEVEKIFENLLNAAPDSVIIINDEGIIEIVNKQTEVLFGYTRQELEGQQLEIIIPERFREIHPKHRQIYFNSPKVRPMGSGLELWGLHKEKGEFPVEISLSPVSIAGNLHVFAAVRDISEQKKNLIALKKVQSELLEKTTELERSNRDLEQFAYMASHDLQEPLRMVNNYLDLLSRRYEEKLDQSAQDFIRIARDGAVRMENMIEDLLTYSRLGKRQLLPKPIDLKSIIAAICTDLHLLIKDTNAKIIFDDVPQVFGDATQLRQLFQNLISNAIKFRGPEPPVVKVTGTKTKHECLLTIQDNGIGIDPKYLERIFLIFFRINARNLYPGTGIGLAICKKIVENHGGKIWVESQPGKGSDFHVSIPVNKSTVEADDSVQ